MPKMTAPDLDRVRELLSYDSDLRNLRWNVDRPPVVRAGDPAGNRHARDGLWGVTIDGRRYPSQYIVRYLDTSLWPSSRIGFKNRNHDDLAPHNLVDLSERYSLTPQAISNRRRAARIRDERRRLEKSRENTALRTLTGFVRYSIEKGVWQIAEPGGRTVISEHKTQQDANETLELRDYINRFLLVNPYKSKAGDERLLSGSEHSAATYYDLASAFAYDPVNGWFYFRHPADKRRLTADYLNTSGRRVVTFWGRQYPAAMLAWFLTHREWPKRKSILPRDGNPDNLALANLYRKRP